MANGRNRGKGDSGRDSGGFVALPWSVLDCPAYATLSHAARGLLLEVARQYHRDDNGRMLLSTAHLKMRGWLSAGVIQKAKQELIEAGFVHQTVQGHRPNKASWYACTWRALDKLPGFDPGAAETFQRGAYRFTAAKPKRAPPKCKNPKKNASLIPAHGIEDASIVPAHGIGEAPPIPPHGTMRATLDALSIPPHGHPLDPHLPVVRSPAIPVCMSPETKAAFLGKTQKRPSAKTTVKEACSARA